MNIGIDARIIGSKDPRALYAREILPRLLNSAIALHHHFWVILPPGVAEPNHAHSNVQFVGTNARPNSVAEQTVFKTLLDRHKLDIVHFLDVCHPIFYRGRTIFTYHGQADLSRSSWSWPIRNLMTTHALTAANHLITFSDTDRRRIIKQYHLDAIKVTTIYGSVDQSIRKCDNRRLLVTTMKQYGIKAPFVICCEPWRVPENMVRLIEAFATVYARNRSLKLVLVGQASHSSQELLERAVFKLRLHQSVILTGAVSELVLGRLLTQAECSVVISSNGFDPLPLNPLFCDCAVVSSRSDCLPEILGDAALYFNVHDAIDMAQKLRLVLDNRALADILIKAGLNRAKDFSWDAAAEKTLALYQSLNESKITTESFIKN